MASDLNKTIVIGRLTRDPELTHTQSGDVVVKFSIAVNGYKDQVSFTTVIRGVSGLSVQNVNIPKDQTQINLPFTATAAATPGKHEITLRATMRVNNQTLTFDQPFNVEIEKVEPKK